MRILLTGITSIHGWPIFRALLEAHAEHRLLGFRPPKATIPVGSNVRSVCMTDRRALVMWRDRFRPHLVIHGAGVCDLDVCEERPDWAHAMNVTGAQNIVEVFGATSRIVYLSTDLVFSGEDPPGSGYTESDPTCPVSVVGRTYCDAERQIACAADHLILRLGLPIGDSIQGAKGAVDWIEGRFRRGLPATLFEDEWRSCIDCEELAAVALQAASSALTGTYHLGGPDPVSLYEIGRQVLARGGYPSRLLRRSSRRLEVDGPPRVGNVHLKSERLEAWLGRSVAPCRWFERRGWSRLVS